MTPVVSRSHRRRIQAGCRHRSASALSTIAAGRATPAVPSAPPGSAEFALALALCPQFFQLLALLLGQHRLKRLAVLGAKGPHLPGTTTDRFSISLNWADTYYFLLSNRFSILTSKTVDARLELRYEERQ